MVWLVDVGCMCRGVYRWMLVIMSGQLILLYIRFKPFVFDAVVSHYCFEIVSSQLVVYLADVFVLMLSIISHLFMKL